MLALDADVLARYYVREEDAAGTRSQHEAARRMALAPPVRTPH